MPARGGPARDGGATAWRKKRPRAGARGRVVRRAGRAGPARCRQGVQPCGKSLRRVTAALRAQVPGTVLMKVAVVPTLASVPLP